MRQMAIGVLAMAAMFLFLMAEVCQRHSVSRTLLTALGALLILLMLVIGWVHWGF